MSMSTLTLGMASPNALKRTYAEAGLDHPTYDQSSPVNFQSLAAPPTFASSHGCTSSQDPLAPQQPSTPEGFDSAGGNIPSGTAPTDPPEPPVKKAKLTFAEKEVKRIEKEFKDRQKAEEKAKREEEKTKKEEERQRKEAEKAKREEDKRAKDAEREEKRRVKEEQARMRQEEKKQKEDERQKKEEEKNKKARVWILCTSTDTEQKPNGTTVPATPECIFRPAIIVESCSKWVTCPRWTQSPQ